MKKIEIEFPDNVNIEQEDIKWMIASKLYEKGRLSLGQSAEMIGVSKRTFIEMLYKYDVSVFNQDINTIEDDIANA
jgi:predicted HTH domain antitoxin